jgi:hypothetical protein
VEEEMKRKTSIRAEVFFGRSGWYFRTVGRNGQKTGGGGESFTRRYDAIRAARRNHPDKDIHVYDRKGELVRVV